MKFESLDKVAFAVCGVAILFVAIIVYAVFIPESSEKVAADNANAERLGYIWGESEIAEANCSDLIINGITARQLLTQDGKIGSSGLAEMRRMAQMPAWYEAYKKGSDHAKSVLKSSRGDAFCKAMMELYGPEGSRAPRLLKKRVAGEERPNFL
jgi:hypothetical protein